MSRTASISFWCSKATQEYWWHVHEMPKLLCCNWWNWMALKWTKLWWWAQSSNSGSKGTNFWKIAWKLPPLLNFASRKSAYSAHKRKVAITITCKLSRFYFAASVFLTITLDDVNNSAAFVPIFCSIVQPALVKKGFQGINDLIKQATMKVRCGTVPCNVGA